MRRLGMVLLLLALVAPAAARDDFKAVVKGIERHYGIRRQHPLLLGFTMFLAKPAMWGTGSSGLKLAVFEDHSRDFTASAGELDRVVAEAVGSQWRPFVRVHSPKGGESSVIYTSFAGKHMRMLIASVERGEIAIVHIKISEKGVRDWMDDPAHEARTNRERREH